MKKALLFVMFFSLYENAQELANIYFLNKDIGWIQAMEYVPYYGYFPFKNFRTTDGGNTWKQLDSQYVYRSIQFVNDSVGFLFSRKGELYKTHDKGETWKFVSIWPYDFIYSRAIGKFSDELNGYCSSSIYITKTTDGGQSWDTLKNWIGSVSDFQVLSKNKIILVDYSNITYASTKSYIVTTDGGVNWDTISIGRRNTEIKKIEFPDSLHGFFSTYLRDPQYPDTPGIFKTTDGGITWNFKPWFLMPPYFSMTDSLRGILYYGLGNPGTFYRTFNGFETWEKMLNKKAYEYFLYSNNLLYACGDSGYFAKSTDCGETWTELPFNVINSTGINENAKTITTYSLQQNYPNPFNPTTEIKYSIPVSSFVSIKVYDILGKEITSLINQEKPAGEYSVTFNGSGLPSGIYFYKIQAGNFTQTKKLILLK